ncbi:ABC transporter substrate-binding protein [Pelagicoccus sp. SDUM812003]|uniref:ABC transporter substrate-binding protein n=1 Tax=Pelagicoccus sp. SDUM812003 TaxID=3041267 RepID=UPI00280C744F|nr:ABC transporter substrate-binding protein [Pelagicoccus sp. SDUM812003]MDQ8204529.1 ABC transporter substrate-binding protein [Pelagicoccus sp. SDUM812003]
MVNAKTTNGRLRVARSLCALSLVAGIALLLASCQPKEPRAIAIGFIGPLSGNAEDLGSGPAKAMELAVKEYNASRQEHQPRVSLHVRDDKWDGSNALPLYRDLRDAHGIELLFMSHTDGTIALQDDVQRDKVVLVNSLNNDALLASMNEYTFTVGKKTEEAAQVVAGRAIELGRKTVRGFHVTNKFMSIFADTFTDQAAKYGLDVEVVPVDIGKTDYREELARFQDQSCDALVFFGYKNLGFAMKQAKEMGLEVPFLGSTTMLGDGFYENSEGALEGTEFSYFTENDGNYVLARNFLERYERAYGHEPFSVWPAMQAYDAMNIALGILKNASQRPEKTEFSRWLRNELHKVRFYQGVCGNLAILDDGTSRGIYFSLYEVRGHGKVDKVKR